MKSIKINFKIFLLPIVAATMILSSCNKELETFSPITEPVVTPPTGTTIAAYISTNSSYSFLDTALVATGLKAAVLNQAGSYTLYAPNNDAFKVLVNTLNPLVPLNAPDATFIAVLKDASVRAQLTQILLYQIMISKVPTASFPTAFPNLSYPSKLPLDDIGGVRMSLFPSARPGINYINNIPITAPDLFTGSNGVVHGTPAILVPASALLSSTIDANTNLTYFKAAIARADSGQTGSNKLSAGLANPLANLTVFAPSDAAFKTTLTGIMYKYLVSQGATPGLATQMQAQNNVNALGVSIFSNPSFYSVLTAQSVRGILVYHIFPGGRAFASNLPPVDTKIPTLLNSQLPLHEGIQVKSTFTSGVATTLNVTGRVNIAVDPQTTDFSGTPATATTKDINTVNGIIHIIDQVLVPIPLSL